MIGNNRNRIWFGLALALTALKLWLSRGQGVYAIGSAGLDDRLFLELAQHLVRGEWLGAYNETTLAKGPFYPLFIAGAFLIGLPLFLAQHIFYATACGLFVHALRPAITSGGLRFAIYSLLLWNPMTYDVPGMGRVLRQQVYGPLALIIFAGLIALYFRRSEPVKRLLPWLLALGLASGAFYLTREEIIWLTPSAVLLSSAFLWGSWRISAANCRRNTLLLALAGVMASLPVLTVCTLNQRHYGWFGTSEFRAAKFQDAYGAMLRVRVGPEINYVPVTREAREAMAAVSPRFALLQQQFDSGLAHGWAGASEFLTHLPPEQGQIGGGWLIWAVREATARAGQCGNAAQALAFYRELAGEINRACDDGRLPAGPERSGFMPPWRDAQTGPFVHAVREFTDFVVRFSRFSGRPPPSAGSAEDLTLFRDITRDRLSPPEGELDVVGGARFMLNLKKTDILHQTGKALRPVLLSLFIVAQMLVLLRLIHAIWQRCWTYPLILATAAWGAGAASILMHAMIEVTSFPVLTITSFAPIYPLLLAFIVAAFWDGAVCWRDRKQTSPSTPTAAPIPPANTETTDIPPNSKFNRALPWVAGGLALLPFLIWQREFRELYWFGDDFLLLDQIAQMGMRAWVTLVFSENFAPLFKLLWGGAALAFNGSYPAMLGLLWLTHALNIGLLVRLLQRAGLGWTVTFGAALLFALTPVNLETLGWSVQWSAVLATSFLLVGLGWLYRPETIARPKSWTVCLPLFLLSAASACSFSRGVLTGPVLALGLVLPAVLVRDWRRATHNLPTALLCLLPAVAVALVIKFNSSGNHQQLAGHWGDVIEFGASYFFFNPSYTLFVPPLHPVGLLLLAAGKIGLLIGGLLLARDRKYFSLLLLLLAYDLGNALLIGVGRYHTGFFAALSSRYQYSSLLATLPFAGVVLAAGLDRVPGIKPRALIGAACMALLAGWCLRGWPAELAGFTNWRGTEMRALIAAPATNDPAVTLPALEFMHVERAKALQRTFNLH